VKIALSNFTLQKFKIWCFDVGSVAKKFHVVLMQEQCGALIGTR
jgi:hypothetical protein